MSEVSRNLLSIEPRLVQLPGSAVLGADPVAWASGLIKANKEQATLQVMEWAQNPGTQDRNAVVDLNPLNARDLHHFLTGVQSGHAVHGRLELLNYGCLGGDLRHGADWAWELCQTCFLSELPLKHPLGFYIKASLWLSAGEHHYGAHCDLADGFLVHLSGRKHVRVWPIPEKYRRQLVFNYADFSGRMSTEAEEFELQPGDVLFIPGGAMHDVVAHDDGSAVSVSFHMGSPYPLLALCRELNGMLGADVIDLPAGMQARDKFGIHFFQPSDHTRVGSDWREHMPLPLSSALIEVLQSGQLPRDQLAGLLDSWWTASLAAPRYQSPYP